MSTTPVGGLHPRIVAAGHGRLPEWVRMAEGRREHVERVVALMNTWAGALGLSEEEATRWRAAGWLHDALRSAEPEELLPLLPDELADLAPALRHGPAAAALLRREGVRDHALLRAVAYHTLGHPQLERMGRALYLADFLEPGRTFAAAWREELRARMPAELEGVLVEVAVARITHLLERRHRIRPETLAFWNALAERS